MGKKELNMRERKKISRLIAERYCKASKKEKGRILDEFVKVFGYNRCYASWLLRMLGRRQIFYQGKERYVILVERKSQKGIRKRPIIYDKEVQDALKRVWYILDMPCGKNLAPYLKEIVSILEERGELKLREDVKEKLIKISASSIDRLLREEKKKWRIKKRSYTKPGSLLKTQIPIKTFADWSEKRPGFIEIDLVDHSGGVARGIYAQTLDATDVFSGWTETICVDNKSQMKVFEGLKKIKERFPFPILGIDSDNGAEFINKHLLKYCEENQITFTRSRAYNKNDSCYVEQKNWTIVRKTVGYFRYETKKEIELLNQIYLYLRLYTNFFQPVRKCIMRIRIGSKIIKKYDVAKTPYQRVIECAEIEEKNKRYLKEIYKRLNPVELRRKIMDLQEKLFDQVRRKKIYEKRKLGKEEIFV